MTRASMVALLCLAGTFVACSTSITEGAPLDISISASRSTVAVGDTVIFSVQAQGAALIGVEIDFGDSASDLYATGGATTAHITFRHPYAASGTYMARAVITDGRDGQKDATVEVRVN